MDIYINEHLAAKAWNLGKVDRHIDVQQQRIELAMQCCTHYMANHYHMIANFL